MRDTLGKWSQELIVSLHQKRLGTAEKSSTELWIVLIYAITCNLLKNQTKQPALLQIPQNPSNEVKFSAKAVSI